MIDKPLNQLNAFFKLAEERTLSGSDQLLYFHLFDQFNKAHWTETVNISDKALLNAMRLYDSTGKPAHVNTIRNAKSRLKLKGFIDFKSGNGSDCTEYQLIQLYPNDTPDGTPNDTPCNTPDDTPCDTVAASPDNNAHAKDGKDVEDVKTLKKERETRAREGGQSISPFGDNGTNSLEVQEMWFRCEGEAIPGSIAMGLLLYEKQHGVEFVCEAIKQASQSNSYPRLSLKWVVKKINELLEGGKANDRATAQNFRTDTGTANYRIDICPDD